MNRTSVSRVEHRLRLKRPRDFADAHNNRAPVIKFECISDLQRYGFPVRPNLGEFVGGADLVHDDSITTAQISQLALNHLRWPAEQRGVVQAHDIAGLEISITEPRLDQSLVERHRPLDAADTAHTIQDGILQWLDVVNELHFGIHHPDVGLGRIAQKAERASHEANEDG